MKHIDPASLSNLESRVAYTTDFLNFTKEDQEALYAATPFVAPLIPDIMEAVYTKLLSYDITAASFVKPNTGYDEGAPDTSANLDTGHPHICYRKNFLEKYILKLVTSDYFDPKTYQYFDRVALMHTGAMGPLEKCPFGKGKQDLRVEYIHMGLLLGYVVDILIPAVMGLEVPNDTKSAVLRAVNKVIWIQNDLFAKHYIKDREHENVSGFKILYFSSC